MGQATSKRRATTRAAQSIAGLAGVIQALKQKGTALHRTYRGKRGGGGETLFCIEPSGIPVKEKAARLAIASGRLCAQADGLFGADTAQTWTLRPRESREQGLRRWSEETHDID